VLDAYGLWKLARRGRDRRERARLLHAVASGEQERERLLKALELARAALDELHDRREELTDDDWDDIAELADEIAAFVAEAMHRK
jgi:hypothetical protein